MRRRRTRKYTWMPTLGGTITNADGSYGSSHFGYLQDVNSDSTIENIRVISLVPDETFFPDQTSAANSSLRDLTEGQDWFLKRIVGKCFVSAKRTSPTVDSTASWPNFIVGAAFFVARAQDDNQELPDLTVDEYDPLGSQNIRQPWIWRRTWVVTDFGVSFAAIDGGPSTVQFAQTNLFYPSALDGPHIDAKTARRIRREERLWFVASVNPFKHFTDSGGHVNNSDAQISISLDYRILGAMRKSKNSSTF